jgi:ElaA protein
MPPELLYQLMAFRESIFVVEQKCPYQELDGRDDSAWHLLGMRTRFPVACLRVLIPQRSTSSFRIGRVAVEESWRGKGLARQMILMAVDRVRRENGQASVVLDAQTYLAPFYVSLGFAVTGDEFLEDGIPHLPMRLEWESMD